MRRPPLSTDPGAEIRDTLLAYSRAIRSLPNEAAKVAEFTRLLTLLFPAGTVKWTQGIEKAVRVTIGGARVRRRLDAYHGDLVIEFENSLRATEEEALRQLREQASGIWAEERPPYRALLCVASDGIVWKVYFPRVVTTTAGPPEPGDIQLELRRTLVLSEDTLREFWLWLVGALFGGGGAIPTAERVTSDFGASSLAFGDAMNALRAAWGAIASAPEAALAFQTWSRYLTVTYGQLGDAARIPELQELFLRHTYLAATARFLVWGTLSRNPSTGSLRRVAGRVLEGEFFRAAGIENLAEDDFFQWVRRPEAENLLAAVWVRMLNQISTYDLERLDADVLKGVYQELVDPKDRHDLGEYYTPDWLCERIVTELLPPRGWPRVIDPTCGSGSFLRAAISHLRRGNPGSSDQLGKILHAVVGIDIHPLAVIIARATYALALGPLLREAKRPIQIPVYLADSLFLPTEVRQASTTEAPGYRVTFGGDRAVQLPTDLLRNGDYFDPAIAAAAQVAADLASGSRESEDTLRSYLRAALPGLSEHAEFEPMVRALWRLTTEFADLIHRHRNSIWAFVIRNGYRPAILREQFDFVVGNPPWLSYRYIEDPEYQAEVKRRATTDYEIAPRDKKLITQMELATIFLVHSLMTFGRPSARLGFVMPRSVLNADQHRRFRDGSHKADLRLDSYWDLLGVTPLFNVPACVVFATRGNRPAGYAELPACELEGKLVARDASRTAVQDRLSEKQGIARLVRLGERTAYSTGAGSSEIIASSPYARAFRQGATIVPRNFYFVRAEGLTGAPDPDRLYAIETDPEQAESAKPPYKDFLLAGQVEGRFLFASALSRHVLPFALLPPPIVFLPVEPTSDGMAILTAKDLRAKGYREAARWMATAEGIWVEKRQRKSERQTVYQRLDYNRELSQQQLGRRWLVLYNAAGTNVCAAVLDRRALALPFVVESKLYWVSVDSQAEADYLAAILNAGAVNEAIKPFQSMGLLGQRDIHKKVLDVPFPRFNPRESLHARTAKLGSEARKEAERLLLKLPSTTSLARQRAAVREALATTLSAIDDAVRLLLSLR